MKYKAETLENQSITLEQEENKVLRASYELTQVKKEFENRVEERRLNLLQPRRTFPKQ